MRRNLLFLSFTIAVLAGALFTAGNSPTVAQGKHEPLISHDVFFTLKDRSPEAKSKLVHACKKYLSGHDGEVFFSAGVVAESLKRDVNDLNFDVALHIVFKDIASQEKYQEAKRHKQFIEENKANWSKVRVFDSLVQR